MNKFDELIKLKADKSHLYNKNNARAVFVPDLGARIFVELDGFLLHRLDIDNVRNPNNCYNNYGGNNFWPAPEGGRFGFNYKDDIWYIQPAINNIPFRLEYQNQSEAKAEKRTILENRKGVKLDVLMTRKFSVSQLSKVIKDLNPSSEFSYEVMDSIIVLNDVSSNDALLACWTLEQFEASQFTNSFTKVQNPIQAINFDFYEDPSNQITYGSKGFFYNTDGKQKGQIGIKKESAPEFLGFYDLERKLLCIREVIGNPVGVHFNIADNEQINGPFSAADVYSIFNGDDAMGFFELETIGGADIKNEKLKGSSLISRTSFGIFDSVEPIKQFVSMFYSSRRMPIKEIKQKGKTTKDYNYIIRK